MEEKDIELMGTVTESLEGLRYRISLDNGNQALADLSGKIRLQFTEVLPGDKVCVVFSPYDLSKGRIIECYHKDK